PLRRAPKRDLSLHTSCCILMRAEFSFPERSKGWDKSETQVSAVCPPSGTQRRTACRFTRFGPPKPDLLNDPSHMTSRDRPSPMAALDSGGGRCLPFPPFRSSLSWIGSVGALRVICLTWLHAATCRILRGNTYGQDREPPGNTEMNL